MNRTRWRNIPDGFIHVCCTCGAKHDVDIRIHKGIYQWKWKPASKVKEAKGGV